MTKTAHLDERAASELVGVLMLIAVFVTAIIVIGAFYISQPVPQKVPAVAMRFVNASNVITIYNTGGDAIAAGKFAILVDGTDVTSQITNSDPVGNWEIGDVISYTKPGGALPSDVKLIYTSLGASSIVIADKVLGIADSPPQPGGFYTITASVVGTGGSISPSGSRIFQAGSNVPYVIQADTANGYRVKEAFVDSGSLGAATAYTFSSLTASHTINASFTNVPLATGYSINVTASAGGTITPGNNTYPLGASQTFTITPQDITYRIASVVIDGGAPNVNSSVTFSNISTNHTVAASFVSNLSAGLIANYYLTESWTSPGATNIAPRIHFADNAEVAGGVYTSDAPSWPLGYIGKDDGFSVSYDGIINITGNDTYTFYLTSDDGSWLTLDGTQIINNGGLHGATTVQTTLYLTTGLHPISVRMYEHTGEALVVLEYSNTTMTQKITDHLYHYAINPPVAGFSGTPTTGTSPLAVQFTETSTDATAWSWDFGDGTNSTLQNPVHTYASTGSYNVTLTAMNSNGANTAIKNNYINVISAGSFLPGFVATYYQGQSWAIPAGTRIDSEIRFADAAGQLNGDPSDEITWAIPMVGRDDDFSVAWDGYLLVNTSDTYTFSLRSDDGSWLWVDGAQLINNGGDHSAATVTGTVTLAPGYHHIIVDMYENGGQAVARLQYSTPNQTLTQVTNVWHTPVTLSPLAGFSGLPVSGPFPLTVSFIDSSSNAPTSWIWTFGDGNGANSTVQNPVHQYTALGIYTVSLTAANTGGSNSMTQTGYISVNPTIAASAGAGGTISPSGNVTVSYGSSQIFNITPTTGYSVAEVTVDGVSQGAIPSYTFTNVQAAHTITATFAINTYTITASAGSGGTLSPSGNVSVNYGGNQTFTIMPNTGYSINGVSVDGVSQGTISSYTFTNVQAGHTISVSFAVNTFVITASAGVGGTISPSGNVSVNYGGSQTFTITPIVGYSVAGVTVDGVSQGAIPSYTFTNVLAVHTISATFTINTYTITASSGANGAVTPTGVTTVNYGGSQTYAITPNGGYSVLAVTVDGANQGAITSYTFTNVAATHTISATFVANPVITASAGANGAISPTGLVTVTYGGSQTFTITPNGGYHLSGVTVDGVAQGMIASYTFTNVVSAHTISATFALNPVITASAGANGVISPTGAVSVIYGGSQTFTITPNAGYSVSAVTVDGANQGAITSYTFTNVVAAHTISATFVKWGAPTVATINPVTGVHGTTITITSITGTNFHTGATVTIGRNNACTTNQMTLSAVNVVSLTQISGTLTIPSAQVLQTYYVCVTNTDAQTGHSGSRIFTVN